VFVMVFLLWFYNLKCFYDRQLLYIICYPVCQNVMLGIHAEVIRNTLSKYGGKLLSLFWVDTSPPFRLNKYTDGVTKALCLWNTTCWAKFKERLGYGECNVLSTNWKIALHCTTQAHLVKWRAELPCFDAQ
jgi:hypothetical protein